MGKYKCLIRHQSAESNHNAELIVSFFTYKGHVLLKWKVIVNCNAKEMHWVIYWEIKMMFSVSQYHFLVFARIGYIYYSTDLVPGIYWVYFTRDRPFQRYRFGIGGVELTIVCIHIQLYSFDLYEYVISKKEKIKNIGPRTLPWVTPRLTSCQSENVLRTFTRCVLPCK